MQAIDTYFVNVAGVSFRQQEAKTALVGDECLLVPEPDNPVDKNAVKVVLKKNDKMIGYIGRDFNATLLEAIDAGFTFFAVVDVAKLTTDSKTFWIQLKVTSVAPE